MFSVDDLMSYLAPYSEMYGTGNPQVDLLIVCGILCILSLLYLLATVLVNRNREPSLISRVLHPDRELEPLVALSKSLDQVGDQLEIQKQYTKQDLGYMSQELNDCRIDFKVLKTMLSPEINSRRRTVTIKSGNRRVPLFKKSA